MHATKQRRLTLRDAIDRQFESSMTWLEWGWWAGRQFGLDLSDEQVDELLWEHSAFPMAGTERTKAQVLSHLHERHGRDS